MTPHTPEGTVEEIDALYEKATKGRYQVRNLHRPVPQACLMSYIFGPFDDTKACVSLGSENEADHHFIAALVNAWPKLREMARENATLRAALKPFADEWLIADESGELQHWPAEEAARCKAAYDALNKQEASRG